MPKWLKRTIVRMLLLVRDVPRLLLGILSQRHSVSRVAAQEGTRDPLISASLLYFQPPAAALVALALLLCITETALVVLVVRIAAA